MNNLYSVSLESYLRKPVCESKPLEYKAPKLIKLDTDFRPRTSVSMRNIRQRLPHRLSSALIPMDFDMIMYMRNNEPDLLTSHREPIRCMFPIYRNTLVELCNLYGLNITNLRTSIYDLKNYYNKIYDLTFEGVDFHYNAIANICMQRDLKNTTLSNVKEPLPCIERTEYPNLLSVLNRYKYQISKMANYRSCLVPDRETIMRTNGIFKTNHNIHHITPKNHDFSSHIVLLGEWFIMYHKEVDGVFFGPMNYLDYLLTISEIMHNLRLCTAMFEYKYINDLVNVLEQLLLSSYNHNDLVDYFKNFESFLLMASDIRADNELSWASFLEVVSALQTLEKSMTGIDIKLNTIMALTSGKNHHVDKLEQGSIFYRLMITMFKFSSLDLIEMSTLHKFIYYAEINEDDGVTKYLKRVHTRRPVDDNSIQEMVALFNKLFIISYVKKHKAAPRFLHSTRKTSYILNAIQTNSISSLEAQPTMYFYDVYPFNCLSRMLTNDPIEFAKDKGALKETVMLIPSDSRKEIQQLIDMPMFTMKDLNLNSLERVDPLVTSIPGYGTYYNCKYPAMLQNKEREQKIEGRLFGTQTMNNKFALSRLMLLAKGALSYIDDQYYTISDEDRKNDLHDAAQLLLDEHNYGIMTDIEGHNQSMQFDNTSELCYRLGLLYGEHDWKNLPLYFNNLDVYYCKQYLQETIHSVGQEGGIEGWMNPIWTLHTTLMMKLFQLKSGYDMKHLAVYSDDTAMIINLPKLSQNILNELYDKLTTHCIKYGMIVKVLQTVVSKSRYTMLRQHYFAGMRADATLKKLIACTIFNCEFCPNEEVEIDGMVSSANSAMELSNHPVTCCALKWYKSVVISLRSFMAFFNNLDSNDYKYLEPIFDNKALYNLLFDLPGVQQHSKTKCIDMSVLLNEYKHLLTAFGNDLSDLTLEQLVYRLKSKYGLSINERMQLTLNSIIEYFLIQDSELIDMFFYRLLCPQSLGGLSVMSNVNQSLSGLSDNVLAKLDTIKWSIDNTFINKKLGFEMMRVSLSNDIPSPGSSHLVLSKKYNFLRDFDYSKLCTSFWPSNNKCKSGTMLFQSAVFSIFKEKVKNLRIMYLLALEEHKMEFQYKIVNELFDLFESRIAMFYADHNIFYVLNKLIKKIETTRSFLLLHSKYNNLVRNSFEQVLTNIRELYKEKAEDYGLIDIDTDIMDYMIKRREKMYPHVKFVNFIEPQYDTLSYECQPSETMVLVHPQSRETVVDGIVVKRRPEFGNEAMYKGEVLDPSLVCQSIEEFLIAKLVTTTKWILSKENYVSPTGIFGDNNILNVCRLASATLTKKEIEPMILTAQLPSGGEILHRIQNLQFKTQASVRVLPNLAPVFTSFIDQTNVNRRQLYDSNIHFDYLRFRCSIAAVYRMYLNYDYKTITQFDLKDVDYVSDVSTSFVVRRDYKLKESFDDWKMVVDYQPNETRIRYLTIVERHLFDRYEIPILPINDQIERELINSNEDYNYSLYLLYRKYCLETLYMYPSEDIHPMFNSVLRSTRQRYPECLEMSDIEVKQYCMSLAKSAIKSKLAEYGRVNANLKDDDLRLDFAEYVLETKGQYKIYRTVLDHLVNFSKRIIKLNSKVTRKTFMNEMKNIKSTLSTKSYKINRDKLIECALILLICKYALTYDIDNDMLVIDQKSTKSRSHVLVTNMDLFENELPAMNMIIDYMDSEFIATQPFAMYQNLVKELVAKSADFDVTSYIFEVPKSSIIQSDEISKSPEMVNILSNISVRSFRVIPDDLVTWDYVYKAIKYRKNLISMYGNPVMYYSTTGSDIYICIYNVLNYIKSKYKIDYVCDVTAGRGDTEYALSQLQIRHKSYGVVDDFTSAYYNKNVIYDFKYDIFDTNTLQFIFEYDTVIIDISYFKGQVTKFSDTILYLLMNNVNLLLRINAVEEFTTSLITWLNVNKPIIEILWVQEENLAHHAVYLYININIVNTEASGKTAWFIALMGDSHRLMSKKHLYDLPIQGFPNSISNLVVSVDNFVGFTETLIDHELEYTKVGLVTRLKQVYNYIDEVFYIPDSLIKDLYKETEVTEKTVHKIGFIPLMYKGLDIEYYAYKKSKRINRMKEHYQLMISGTVEIHSVKLNNYNDKFIRLIRSRHPVAQVRSAFSTLYSLYEHNKEIINMTPYDMIKYEETIKVEYPLIENKMSSRIRGVYLVMIMAALNNDYKYGLQQLLSYNLSSVYKKSEIVSKIAIYKKLGSLYIKIRNHHRNWENMDKYISKLRKYVFFPTARKIKRTFKSNPDKNDDFNELFNNPKLPEGAKDQMMKWVNDFSLDDLGFLSTISDDIRIDSTLDLRDVSTCIPENIFVDTFSNLLGVNAITMVKSVAKTDFRVRDLEHSYVPLIFDLQEKKYRSYSFADGSGEQVEITDEEYADSYPNLFKFVDNKLTMKPMDQWNAEDMLYKGEVYSNEEIEYDDLDTTIPMSIEEPEIEKVNNVIIEEIIEDIQDDDDGFYEGAQNFIPSAQEPDYGDIEPEQLAALMALLGSGDQFQDYGEDEYNVELELDRQYLEEQDLIESQNTTLEQLDIPEPIAIDTSSISIDNTDIFGQYNSNSDVHNQDEFYNDDDANNRLLSDINDMNDDHIDNTRNISWGDVDVEDDDYVSSEDIIDCYPELKVEDDDIFNDSPIDYDESYYNSKHDLKLTLNMLIQYGMINSMDITHINLIKKRLVEKIQSQRYKRAIREPLYRAIDFPDVPYEYFDISDIDYFNYKDVDPEMLDYYKLRRGMG